MLLNALPLQILDGCVTVQVRNASCKKAREALERGGSAIGHADLAAVLGAKLGVPVPVNRTTLPPTQSGDVVIATYIGPRLEAGTTSLPEGARIDLRWVRWRLTEFREMWPPESLVGDNLP